jgi:hypothetical protein
MKQRHIIYNTVQASGADVSLADGVMSLNNPADSSAVRILVSKIRRRFRRAVTAAVAQVSGVTISNQVPLLANQLYVLEVTFPSVNVGVNLEKIDPYVKKYTWFSGATAPTAAQLVTALQALVQADQTRKVNAGGTSPAITITQVNAAEGPFVAKINDFVIPVTTQNALATGSKAYVESFIGPTTAVSAAANYIHFEIVDTDPEEPSNLSGVETQREIDRVTHIFIDAAATNSASLDTGIVAILDGTATAANFLGAPPQGQSY